MAIASAPDGRAVASPGIRDASFYSLQLLSKSEVVRAKKNSTFGIAVRSTDQKTHSNVQLCLTLPASIVIVRPLHGGRKKSARQVCWPKFTAKPNDPKILDLVILPRKAGKKLPLVANLTAPDIVVPATATWRIAVAG